MCREILSSDNENLEGDLSIITTYGQPPMRASCVRMCVCLVCVCCWAFSVRKVLILTPLQKLGATAFKHRPHQIKLHAPLSLTLPFRSLYSVTWCFETNHVGVCVSTTSFLELLRFEITFRQHCGIEMMWPTSRINITTETIQQLNYSSRKFWFKFSGDSANCVILCGGDCDRVRRIRERMKQKW